MDWGQVFRGFVPTAMTLDQQNELKKQRELDEAYRQEQLRTQQDQFSKTYGLQSESHKAAMDKIARQLGADNEYANLQSFGQSVADNRGAISKMAGDLRAKVGSGEITQDQYAAAMANYNPTNIAKQGSAVMSRGYGAQAGMQAENQLMELSKKALMQQAQKFVAAGDYKGLAEFFADNNNYADGNSYAFHGVDPKTKNLVFSMNGQQQPIPAHLLPGYIEAHLDPSKGIEFAKTMSQDERWREMIASQKEVARIQAGARGTSGGVNITTDQQKQLSDLTAQYYEAKGADRARIGQNIMALQNQIAIANKRFPSLSMLDDQPKTQLPWKLSNDGMYRSNDQGDVEDWNAQANQWVTRGAPTISSAAKEKGVSVVRANGRYGFAARDGNVYTSEAEAIQASAAAPKPSPQQGLPTRTDGRQTASVLDVTPLGWLLNMHPDNLRK